MPSISGELLAGEAQGALRAIQVRQRGSAVTYYGVMLGLMGAGALAGELIGGSLEHASPDTAFGSGSLAPLGIALGGLAYLLLARPLLVRRFRSGMQARGFSIRFTQTFGFDDAGVTVRTGAVTRSADWSAVSEVFKAREYWVFFVQMEGWYAPARFFASQDEERAFLREALGHMTQEARERSGDAVRYAGRA